MGRWRTQMSADEISAFEESGTEFFRLFGYERPSRATAATTTIGAPHPPPVDNAEPRATDPTLAQPQGAAAARSGRPPPELDGKPTTDAAAGADGHVTAAAGSADEATTSADRRQADNE